MTIAQADAVFSKSRRQGYKEDVTTWGQLGLTGDWANKPLSLYGRNSASGTYGFFKEHTLKNGDYKDSVKEQPGSASVVQGITVDRFAVGYSGIGYATAGVRPVPLAEKEADKCYEADQDNAYAGSYPLSRFLYVYVNRAPSKPLEDRKSTRLNSSHLGISYAVFFLKKKKRKPENVNMSGAKTRALSGKPDVVFPCEAIAATPRRSPHTWASAQSHVHAFTRRQC